MKKSITTVIEIILQWFQCLTPLLPMSIGSKCFVKSPLGLVNSRTSRPIYKPVRYWEHVYISVLYDNCCSDVGSTLCKSEPINYTLTCCSLPDASDIRKAHAKGGFFFSVFGIGHFHRKLNIIKEITRHSRKM